MLAPKRGVVSFLAQIELLDASELVFSNLCKHSRVFENHDLSQCSSLNWCSLSHPFVEIIAVHEGKSMQLERQQSCLLVKHATDT